MVYERLTHKARRILALAKRERVYSRNKLVGPEHILMGVFGEDTGIGAKALKKLDFHPGRCRLAAKGLPELAPSPATSDQPWMSDQVKYLFERSWGEAQRLGDQYISTEHLLLAVIMHPRVAKVLRAQNVSAPMVRRYLLRLMGDRSLQKIKI
jgi:ATP-dependent Clp protease ATP-binding subunit ClpC